MSLVHWLKLRLWGAAVFLLFLSVQVLGASDLRVEVFPEELFPGQALLVRMASSLEIESVSADLKGQNLVFFPEGDQKSWISLAGMDLNLAPRVHILSYRVQFVNGYEVEGTYGLRVQPKAFPEERITVEKKYVHLSREDLARHQREKKKLSAIYKRQGSARPWREAFSVPVDVARGSRFGLRRIINGEPRSPHSGTDLKAGTGTPVGASNAGKVVFSGDLFFSGNTVILDHGGGLFTLYAHLSKLLVADGDQLKKGDILGHVGATGRVTGPHLHWGVKLNGARIDPFSLIALPIAQEAEASP